MATVRIVQRSDTYSNWVTSNPVLSQGELGFDVTNIRIKIGDGVSRWNDLSYLDTNVPLTQNVAALELDVAALELDVAALELPIHGRMSSAGVISGSSGFTGTRISTGRFRITHNIGHTEYTCLASVYQIENYDVYVLSVTSTYADFIVRQTSTGAFNNFGFHWVIMKD